jgi:hypothetical protein
VLLYFLQAIRFPRVTFTGSLRDHDARAAFARQ